MLSHKHTHNKRNTERRFVVACLLFVINREGSFGLFFFSSFSITKPLCASVLMVLVDYRRCHTIQVDGHVHRNTREHNIEAFRSHVTTATIIETAPAAKVRDQDSSNERNLGPQIRGPVVGKWEYIELGTWNEIGRIRLRSQHGTNPDSVHHSKIQSNRNHHQSFRHEAG